VISNLSIILSIVLTKESILAYAVEVEGSSLTMNILYVLCLDLLANRFSSTLTTLFFISSRVAKFLSLN
jgi:hypothetical protein